jgi:hypothetical protein
MNMSSLRSNSFWLILVTVAVVLTANVSGNLMDAFGRGQLASDARASAAELSARASATQHQLGSLEGVRTSLAIVSADGTQAAAHVQSSLQQAFQGGAVLSLRTQANDNGIVSAQFLWRGTEEELRAGLEAFAVSLPQAQLIQLNIRSVSVGNQSLLEYRVNVLQPWELSS